jgi:hypothetical protein
MCVSHTLACRRLMTEGCNDFDSGLSSTLTLTELELNFNKVTDTGACTLAEGPASHNNCSNASLLLGTALWGWGKRGRGNN